MASFLSAALGRHLVDFRDFDVRFRTSSSRCWGRSRSETSRRCRTWNVYFLLLWSSLLWRIQSSFDSVGNMNSVDIIDWIKSRSPLTLENVHRKKFPCLIFILKFFDCYNMEIYFAEFVFTSVIISNRSFQSMNRGCLPNQSHWNIIVPWGDRFSKSKTTNSSPSEDIIATASPRSSIIRTVDEPSSLGVI